MRISGLEWWISTLGNCEDKKDQAQMGTAGTYSTSGDGRYLFKGSFEMKILQLTFLASTDYASSKIRLVDHSTSTS